MDFTLDIMRDGDWSAVRNPYVEGLATGNATFETQAPEWHDWDGHHLTSCRLVARSGDWVGGWAALSPVSRRPAYSGVAEVSIYVASGARGLGAGNALLRELVRRSEESGVWTLQASIFPENTASIAIHKGCGFREVGYRERISSLHGHWRDTVIMERRSRVVGA
ncbi:MAG: N-acetyltransferase [Chloroflexi bacterium]|nr:N-acetyltransferase [Chloroflexota bacterium]MCI0896634.1 N-acetyltransferase [Chloroflexota bacterium]